MKSLRVERLALLAIVACGSANAADMPVKAPYYKAPPLVSDPWSGFYLGLNAGGSIGQDHTADTTSLPGPFAQTFDAASFTHVPIGAIFGGQVGWNWHLAPAWLVGLEGDWQWSAQKETVCTYACLPTSTPPALLLINDQQSLKWFATARARVGWLAPGGTLWYATGGAAWGNVEQNLTLSGLSYFAGGPTFGMAASQTKVGWTVGAGVEAPIADNWTLKAEYLYLDLGATSQSAGGNLDPLAVANFLAPSQTTASTSSIRDHIVRVGANYHLDGGASPYAPSPRVAHDAGWTGFYAGVDGGGAIARASTVDAFTFGPVANFPNAGQDAFSHGGTGALVGGQVGWNWRVLPAWVLGAEADFQWMHQADSACISSCLAGAAPGILEGLIDTVTVKSFGTARARAGWLAPNGALLYATGGAAWSRVDQTQTILAAPLVLAAGVPASASFSQDRIGWTVGGGVEFPLWGQWSAKAEYLYVNFGSVTNTFASALDPVQLPSTTLTTSSSFTIQEHIARFGVNYHLN